MGSHGPYDKCFRNKKNVSLFFFLNTLWKSFVHERKLHYQFSESPCYWLQTEFVESEDTSSRQIDLSPDNILPRIRALPIHLTLQPGLPSFCSGQRLGRLRLFGVSGLLGESREPRHAFLDKLVIGKLFLQRKEEFNRNFLE